MKCRMLIAILFIASSVFSQSIKLLSPNGGEFFDAGQEITIRWTADEKFGNIQVLFSRDNGTTWNFWHSTPEADTLSVIVPHLKEGTENALIKVRSDFDRTVEDISDGKFTIRASPPDAYEPNDDFASARPIGIGDSVVKNAVVIGVNSSEYDDDFYKVNLDGNRFTVISVIGYHGFFFMPLIRLYEASGRQLADGVAALEVNIAQSGDYYLKVSYDDKTTKGAVQSYEYGLSIHQSDGPSITLLTPNGGETFSAEQMVPVKCTANFALSAIDVLGVQYSIDSGKIWRNAWYEFSDSSSHCLWRVPHLKNGTNRALFKVFARDSAKPAFDVSNEAFTILASAKDAYEPNDDFATARVVEVGDSVVKNAMVIKSFVDPDSTGIDTSLTDVDFFKINLTAGKVATISEVSRGYWDENDFEDMLMGNIQIRLYDASKNMVEMGDGSLSCYISQSGVYYCEISAGIGGDCWNKYSLSIRQNNPVNLISPNGGENYQAGQRVTVRWDADTSYEVPLYLYYSINNGTSWMYPATGQPYDNSCTWTVPALKTRTDQALFKIAAITEIEGRSDISNGTFTIQPAPLDAYEPNDDITSAYPVAVGDSVVKNASTYQYADVQHDDTANAYSTSPGDTDYYKVNLTAGSLVKVRSWTSKEVGIGMPDFNLFDASGKVSPIHYSEMPDNKCYAITQSGVYYFKVRMYGSNGLWCKYGLSINSMITFLTQTTLLDKNALQLDESTGFYRSQLIADSANLTIDFTVKEKNRNQTTTMVLAPKDFAPLPDEKAKIKAIAVFSDYQEYTQIGADITIPYDPSDLGGYPENTLAVVCRDYKSGDEWYPVESSIDSVKHQIVVHMPSLNRAFFQVYVKTNLGSASNFAKTPPIVGMRANYLSQKKSFAVQYFLPTSINTELTLYNVQGKCIRKDRFSTEAGSSTHLWNLGGLGSGKYFLNMRAGAYHVTRAILIMN